MDKLSRSAIVVSASSGIGQALCESWIEKGWKLFGTYRTGGQHVDHLTGKGVKLVCCDLQSKASVIQGCKNLKELCPNWDVLVLAAGKMDPVGPFDQIDFDAWEEAIQVNFLNQMRIVHQLLPTRNLENSSREPCVLFFAGGGTNNAVSSYSSYAISKIALTKMCEFLDAEIPDTRFVIVGPGWVKTKIHETTLKAGPDLAGKNYERTLAKMQDGDWVPLERVVECCTWLATTGSRGVRGRNFSVAHDRFNSEELEKALESDPNMYKLRRYKNDWQPAGHK